MAQKLVKTTPVKKVAATKPASKNKTATKSTVKKSTTSRRSPELENSKIDELELVLAKNKKVMEQKFKEREAELKRRRQLEKEALTQLEELRVKTNEELEKKRIAYESAKSSKDNIQSQTFAIENEIKILEIKLESKNAEIAILEQHSNTHLKLNISQVKLDAESLVKKLEEAKAKFALKVEQLEIATSTVAEKEAVYTELLETVEIKLNEVESQFEELKKHNDIEKVVDVIAYDIDSVNSLDFIINKGAMGVERVEQQNIEDGYKTVSISLSRDTTYQPTQEVIVDNKSKNVEIEKATKPVVDDAAIAERKRIEEIERESAKLERQGKREEAKKEFIGALNANEAITKSVSIKQKHALMISIILVVVTICSVFALGFVL